MATATAEATAFSTPDRELDVDVSRLTPEHGVARLGVDETGATHYLRKRGQEIVVVDAAGDPEHVEDLSGSDAGTWLAYVRDRRGWIAGGDDGTELIDLLLAAIK